MKRFGFFFSGFWAKIAISLFYCITFYFAYINFLNFYFSYAGYDLIEARKENFLLILITLLFGVLPIFFFRGIKTISSFLCIFIYFILYVPIIVTFHFAMKGNVIYVIYQQMLFVFGMSILFVADRIVLKNSYTFKTNLDLFKVVLILTIAITIFMMIVYRGNLRIVSFADVYDLRSENEELGHGVVMGYLSSWLVSVLIPLCLAYSIFAKKWVYFLVGIFGCVIVYMATGAKTAVVFPIVTYLIYKLFTNFNLKYSFFALGLGLSITVILISVSEFNVISSLIMMRTIGNGGDLAIQYHDFFINHPKTYYSHINVVNLITNSYPYNKPLGQVIGNYYLGDTNSNASFWATDGYASAGDLGVVLASIFLFMIFVLFNSISKSYNKIFIIIVLIPFITSFLNSSMFQSLMSGGAILTFFFLSFSSIKRNNYIIQ